MEKIDFVVTWVDGNDAEWQVERSRFLSDEGHDANAINRFRDWNLMKYWFRGIEKFAPWVNNIYFVTWGHYPEWLNTEHQKLKMIKHEMYIPKEYLPTFNSNVIELFLHNIPGLSEQFVLFNDDTFLTDRVKNMDFFQHGLPLETVRLGMVESEDVRAVFPHTVLNNTAIINKHFAKREVLKKYWKKFFAIKYGADILRNFLLMPFKFFSAFYDTHLPASHLKSTFYEVWEKEPEILQECGTHRFRTREDVTHWLMKNWRFCKGEFVPRSNKWGRCFEIGQDDDMISAIKKQKYKAICINDSDPNLDFEKYQKELIEAFETILPEKSSFEK
ncbi:MAG: Stealth CR1 domain-containing protein [Oscillospiraceae bacterium]|nr:Stealth CR1 domain-containing protein [Oscillospiraceae bacterium]